MRINRVDANRADKCLVRRGSRDGVSSVGCRQAVGCGNTSSISGFDCYWRRKKGGDHVRGTHHVDVSGESEDAWAGCAGSPSMWRQPSGVYFYVGSAIQ